MEGFDYRGFASFYIIQQWNAVFHPEADKTSKEERAEAYFFFVATDPYWEEQRKIWCNDYLDIHPSVFMKKFHKTFQERKYNLSMPVIYLKPESIKRLNCYYDTYMLICKDIKKMIRYYEKNTLTYKNRLPFYLKKKAEYDRIFTHVLRHDMQDNIVMKMGVEVKHADAFFKRARIQRWAP